MRIEVRSDKVILDGYVNAVLRDSKPLLSPKGMFIEQVKEGVFQRAINNANDVKLLFNHNENRELGSIKSGNLQLFEDSIGLRAIAEINDPEVMEKAKNNELRGWSFGFANAKDEWQESEPYQRRYLNEFELLEVSILDKTPAYNATTVEAREDKQVLNETRSEDFKSIIVEEQNQDHEEIRNYDNSKFKNEILRAMTF